MKGTMSFIGFSSLSLMLLGILFKIQHWPGAGVMLVLGTFLFVTVFLLLFLIDGIKNRKNVWNVAEVVAKALMLFLLMNGLLFKLMHWPGGGALMVLGLVFTAVVFIPIFAISFYQEERFRDKMNFLWIGVVVVAVALAISVRTSKVVLDSFIVNEAYIAQNNEVQLIALESMKKEVDRAQAKNEKVERIYKETLKMYEEIEFYKIYLYTVTRGLADNDLLIKENFTLKGGCCIDNYDIPTHILIGPEPSSPVTGNYSAYALKERMIQFHKTLKDNSQSDVHYERIDQLFDFNDVLSPSGMAHSWEAHTFYNVTLAGTIQSLSSLQNAVAASALLIVQEHVEESKS